MKDMNIKEDLSRLLESEEMQKYFIDNYDRFITDDDKLEMIDGARRNIYDKLYLLKKLSNIKKANDLAAAYEFAIDNLKSLPGDVFLLGKYHANSGCNDAVSFSPHLSFDAALGHIKKLEIGFPELDGIYEIEKYSVGKSDAGKTLKFVVSYRISPELEIWDFQYDGHPYAFDGIKIPLNLPHPFKEGDIVRIDCSPFLPVKAAIIIEQPEHNWGCCFPQIAFVNKDGYVDTGALKHLRAYSDEFDCYWAVSPMYRLQTYKGELPEQEKILTRIRNVIKEHPEVAHEMSYGRVSAWEQYDKSKQDKVIVSIHVCDIKVNPNKKVFFFEVDPENEVYSNDEYGVLFNKDKTKLIRGVCGLRTYHVPPTVREIGNDAFNFAGAWDTELVIPEGVKIIGDRAFLLMPGCPELPQSITKLGEEFCVGSFTVGKNVCEIAECVSLYNDAIYVDSANEYFKIWDDALYSMDMTRLLHVFSDKETYKIPEGVKRIDQGAFFANNNIRHIYIPASVRYIGCYSFSPRLDAVHVSPDNPCFCDVDGVLYNKDKTIKIK